MISTTSRKSKGDRSNVSRAPQSATEGIGSASFQSLLVTQWLTAINDNAFRWFVVGIGKQYVSSAGESWILTLGLACFVLPYLVLAAPAGFLADRFSKRDVIVSCKIAEIAIMIFGILAIYAGQLPLLFVVVALMGAQSALFSPAKLGTIPELLPPEKISAANGLFGLSTVTATIFGMGLGLWLSDITVPKGQANLALSSGILIGLAGVGTAISLLIRRSPAANRASTFPWNLLLRTCQDLNRLRQQKALFFVALGIVFFWGLGAIAHLNIDQYAGESGAFLQSERIPFLVSLVLGIGTGSILAGFWSAGRIELGMLTYAAAFISLFAAALYFVPDQIFHQSELIGAPLVASILGLFGLGAAAGVFNVPLAAYLQYRSPATSRGSVLSATNFMLYAGIMISALLFLGMRLPVHEGSLARIPADILDPTLDGQQQFRLDRRLKSFRAAWQDFRSRNDSKPASTEAIENLPQFQDDLPAPGQGGREMFMAELLWEEIEQRRQSEQTQALQEYLDRCLTHPNLSADDRLLVKEVYEQAGGLPMFSSRQIFLVLGMAALPIAIFIFWRLPQASARFAIWSIVSLWFQVKVEGKENFPDRKPFVLIGNWGGWFPRLMAQLVTVRRMRIVTWRTSASRKRPSAWSRFWGMIHVAGGPMRSQQAMAEARKTVQRGNALAVFPEADGYASPRLPADTLRLTEGLLIPHVPVLFQSNRYLDGDEGGNFSGGSLFGMTTRLLRGFRHRITIRVGPPIEKPADYDDLTHKMESAMSKMTNNPADQHPDFMAPARKFIRQAKLRKSTWKAGDSTGASLKGGELLVRSLILRRLLNRHVLAENEPFVGLLLPPSVPGAVANLSLALDRRVAVNLNYTASQDVINSCIQQAGIKHVLTSRKVISKLGYEPKAELVMLEDLRDKVTLGDKLQSYIHGMWSSAAALERKLKLDQVAPDDLLTVIFTSGSTGKPKGVMLTQNNVAANLQSFSQAVHFHSKDVFLGILPFFHSFGYTVCLWAVMTMDIGVAFHFNPLDAKQVGSLCSKFKGTFLLATPTFLRSYIRRCSAKELSTLEVVVAGAEPLTAEVADAFYEKFDLRPYEGYGATELSPVACVNVPPDRSSQPQVNGAKEGTVGRPLPGVEAKVVDLDSGKALPANQAGMLWIKGANVMKGYLGQQDLTAKTIVDGWYKTGDVAFIDEEGFVKITGRISRFSKIGGEMVPHLPVEEVLAGALSEENEEGVPMVAVTAVPDSKKGERICVVHCPTKIPVEQMIEALKQAGLPAIGIPSADSFIEVESIPVLGTGKLDLSGVRRVALDQFGAA